MCLNQECFRSLEVINLVSRTESERFRFETDIKFTFSMKRQISKHRLLCDVKETQQTRKAAA